jgi:hypothetical protein
MTDEHAAVVLNNFRHRGFDAWRAVEGMIEGRGPIDTWSSFEGRAIAAFYEAGNLEHPARPRIQKITARGTGDGLHVTVIAEPPTPGVTMRMLTVSINGEAPMQCDLATGFDCKPGDKLMIYVTDTSSVGTSDTSDLRKIIAASTGGVGEPTEAEDDPDADKDADKDADDDEEESEFETDHDKEGGEKASPTHSKRGKPLKQVHHAPPKKPHH